MIIAPPLHALVGLGFLALWVRQESGWRPRLPSDELPVLVSFTGLLLLLGASLFVWSAEQHRVRAGAVPVTGAVVAAASDVVEDGAGLEWAFWPFITATAVLIVGQLVLAARSRAVVPALSGLGIALYPVAGGPLLAAAWLTAAFRAAQNRVGTLDSMPFSTS